MHGQTDSQCLFRIGKSPIHGEGMFATTFIPAGTFIGQEDPLLVFDTGIGFQAWHKDGEGNFYTAERRLPHSDSIKTKVIERHVNNLYQRDRNRWTAFRELHAIDRGVEGDKVSDMTKKYVWQLDIDRVESNAFVFKQGRHAWLAVYYTVSRINHSCLPNTMLVPLSTDKNSLGRTRLIATKDIAAGEELFIQYCIPGKDAWLLSAPRRQEALQQAKHFHCTCNACSNPSSSDEIFSRLADLVKDLKLQGQKLPRESLAHQSTKGYGGRSRIEKVLDHIARLRVAGFCDERLSEAYLLLALLHEEQREWAEALDATTSGFEVEKHFLDEGVELKNLAFVREKCLGKLMGGHS